MEISIYDLSSPKNKISEGTIFNAVKGYIKSTNFPKKLVLKKMDLLIEKRKIQVSKYAKLLVLSRKTDKEMLSQINVLSSRNSRDIQDLIDFLS